MVKGKTKLRDKWLTHASYKDWLRKEKSDYYGYCGLCQADISVGNGVEDALKKHAGGETQKPCIRRCC